MSTLAQDAFNTISEQANALVSDSSLEREVRRHLIECTGRYNQEVATTRKACYAYA